MSSAKTWQMNLFDGVDRAKDEPRMPLKATRIPDSKTAGESLRVCVLGSGSGGNSTVIRLGDKAVLIDAGFGPLTTAHRLRQARLQLADIGAICLTHLDQDHFRPTWMATLLRGRIKLHLHRWRLEDLKRLEGGDELRLAGLVHPFDGQPFAPVEGLNAIPIHLAHDEKGTTGFRLETSIGHIGYATDLGHVPPQLIDTFAGVDLLAIESNYDPQMQLASSRPMSLKRRIMGRTGHLSNQQAFEAVKEIVRRSPPDRPRQVLLLHRSAQCNRPELVRKVFDQDPDIARRLALTEQRRPTSWFSVCPTESQLGQQMPLSL